MKTYREELTFNTKQKREYINITPRVQEAILKSGIKEGLVLVNPMHITASVYINDDERSLTGSVRSGCLSKSLERRK